MKIVKDIFKIFNHQSNCLDKGHLASLENLIFSCWASPNWLSNIETTLDVLCFMLFSFMLFFFNKVASVAVKKESFPVKLSKFLRTPF